MTILSERVGLDTNVILLGLRKQDAHSERLVAHLDRLRPAFPAQVLRELAANLTLDEMRRLHALLRLVPDSLLDWRAPPEEAVQRYRSLGCKRGDALIAAGIEAIGATTFVSNNRHFLFAIHGLPFRVLAPDDALREIESL